MYDAKGLTVVISPLIALMRDQVDALVARDVKAASLDSTLDAESARFVKNEVLSGSLKILYVAPERCDFHLPLLSTDNIPWSAAGCRMNRS